jgi:hypothetical protein
MEKIIKEDNILIARRIAPGDRWRLVVTEPDGTVYKTLTDCLEAYMLITNHKGEYRLAPLKSELYAISTTEEEVKVEPEKKYSLYGEFGE